MPKRQFEDTILFITSAAGGLGFAAAHQAARKDAKLILAYRTEETSKSALSELQAALSDS